MNTPNATQVKSPLRYLPGVFASKKSATAYLTFDDGPDEKITPQLLVALHIANVRATFFMLGEAMDRHPDIVRAVREAGHSIGLHGYEHLHNRRVSLATAWRDLQRMSDVAKRHQIDLRWYRPPYGELTLSALIWSWFKGVRIVLWNRDSRDFDATDAASLTQQLLADMPQAGDIVLFHDDSAVTAAAMTKVLQHWRTNGLQCQGLDDRRP